MEGEEAATYKVLALHKYALVQPLSVVVKLSTAAQHRTLPADHQPWISANRMIKRLREKYRFLVQHSTRHCHRQPIVLG